MDVKSRNYEAAKTLLLSRYWLPEYAGLFTGDFRIELPSAPPGMPQVMDEFDVELYFGWMAATVKTWDVELHELYGTPDPELFWGVSTVTAHVFWGGSDGVFTSRRFSKLRFKDGKLAGLKEVTDPLKYLEAAGREVPLFKMDLTDARIDKALARSGPAHHTADAAALDAGAEAVSQRIAANLKAFTMADYWTAVSTVASYAPDLDSKVWFLPPEMRESYPPEEMPRVEMWSVLSCPVINFDRRGRAYPTDDPQVWFCEYMCSGITDWIGNNTPGSRYRNRYFYILRFNDLGQIRVCEEILNPINKYNSINVSLPTFPYYF